MATIPDELRAQLAREGILIASSLDDYFCQLTVYGRSALWLPHDVQPALPYTRAAVAPAGEGVALSSLRQVRETFFTSRTEDASSLTATEVASRIACMQAWFRSACPAPPVAPTATPLSGSGYYGQSCPREIPDTPIEEWNAGVEALLADYEQWQAQTDEVLHAHG